jgi:uncharacterized protein YjbI with pentapeptide repeats
MVCGSFFSRANLSGANLEGADLSGANLGAANLSGSNPVRGDTQESGCSPGAHFDLSSTTRSAPATTDAEIIVYDEASPT